MIKVFLIYISIALCYTQIPLNPEVSNSYYGVKDNHAYTYGNFLYVNQLTNRELIYSDAIYFNNIIFRQFNLSFLGDINQDDVINIQDIVLIVGIIFNNEYDDIADMNQDSSINIQDIILIVNVILGFE